MLSCSDDSLKSDETGNENLQQLMRMEDDAQRVTYGLLNENEKLAVWQESLNLHLQDTSLNSDQKDLIQELIDELSAELFSDKTSPVKEGFKNIFVPDFLSRVETKFTVEQAETYFYRLPDQIVKPSPEPVLIKTCNCNKGSMFGCGAGNDCKDKKCSEPEKNDCGFLWMWECNGLCAIYS